MIYSGNVIVMILLLFLPFLMQTIILTSEKHTSTQDMEKAKEKEKEMEMEIIEMEMGIMCASVE